MKSSENLIDHIFYVDIGQEEAIDLFHWQKGASTIFRSDILAIRKMAKDNFFLHVEKLNRKSVFIKFQNLIFLVVADDSIQYQLLEAVLEEMHQSFFEQYAGVINNYLMGMESILDTFKESLPLIFENAHNNRIFWLTITCSMCEKKRYQVCVRKSLISQAKSFPVSLVYRHEGHGLLVYIDGDSKIRGTEIVEITG